jgi:hypothetical protein
VALEQNYICEREARAENECAEGLVASRQLYDPCYRECNWCITEHTEQAIPVGMSDIQMPLQTIEMTIHR